MSTNHNDMEQQKATKTHAAVSSAVNSLSTGGMEMENTAGADTPAGRVQRLVKVYGSIKPLLTTLSMLPIIPAKWREALRLFIAVLDDFTLGDPLAHTLPIEPKVAVE
jgi:hypothetical protein